MDLPGKEKYNIFYRCTAKGIEYNRKGQMEGGGEDLREEMRGNAVRIDGHLRDGMKTVQWKFPTIYEGGPNEVSK